MHLLGVLLTTNPTTHRLEHNLHYTYTVHILKYRMLPEDVGAYNVFINFNFLIILKVQHYVVLTFRVIIALVVIELTNLKFVERRE